MCNISSDAAALGQQLCLAFMDFDGKGQRACVGEIACAVLPVAKGHYAFVVQPEPAEPIAGTARRDGHIRHCRHAWIGRIEKLADATHLAAVPIADGGQHIVGLVAIGTAQQLTRVDQNDLVRRDIAVEYPLQTHVIVMRMTEQRDDPYRRPTGRRGDDVSRQSRRRHDFFSIGSAPRPRTHLAVGTEGRIATACRGMMTQR